MSQRSALIAAAIATAEVSEPPRPERGDAAGLRIDALEAGDDGDFLALLEALDQLGAVDVEDARRGMRVAGLDRDLPALPGARLDAHALQHDREQAGGDLFAGGDHGVIFARVMHRRGLGAPADQLVGLARHRRDHDGDLVAGVDLALDMPRDVADAVDIGDGCAAEFHHEAAHDDALIPCKEDKLAGPRETGGAPARNARIHSDAAGGKPVPCWVDWVR